MGQITWVLLNRRGRVAKTPIRFEVLMAKAREALYRVELRLQQGMAMCTKEGPEGEDLSLE